MTCDHKLILKPAKVGYVSFLNHPKSSRFIQLHEWQVDFCQGNHCAAALLSFFSSWHDWKIKNDDYYRRYNDIDNGIAEILSDNHPDNQNAYLFFTPDYLADSLMGLFDEESINDSFNLLVTLHVITIHKNPNPHYYFDRTRYFKFYPAVCNKWLQERDLFNKTENDI